MGRTSLISIGHEEYKILELFYMNKSIKEIRNITGKSPQAIHSFKANLESAGWITKVERGKYKVTENGEYFLKLLRRLQ